MGRNSKNRVYSDRDQPLESTLDSARYFAEQVKSHAARLPSQKTPGPVTPFEMCVNYLEGTLPQRYLEQFKQLAELPIPESCMSAELAEKVAIRTERAIVLAESNKWYTEIITRFINRYNEECKSYLSKFEPEDVNSLDFYPADYDMEADPNFQKIQERIRQCFPQIFEERTPEENQEALERERIKAEQRIREERTRILDQRKTEEKRRTGRQSVKKRLYPSEEAVSRNYGGKDSDRHAKRDGRRKADSGSHLSTEGSSKKGAEEEDIWEDEEDDITTNTSAAVDAIAVQSSIAPTPTRTQSRSSSVGDWSLLSAPSSKSRSRSRSPERDDFDHGSSSRPSPHNRPRRTPSPIEVNSIPSISTQSASKGTTEIETGIEKLEISPTKRTTKRQDSKENELSNAVSDKGEQVRGRRRSTTAGSSTSQEQFEENSQE
ncbi:hypothetical protein JCM5350_001138 [Sporobolomyces pararoseus]